MKVKQLSIRELAIALAQHCDDLQYYINGVSEDAVFEFESVESSILEIIYEIYSRFAGKHIEMTLENKKYLEGIQIRLKEIRDNIIEDIDDELEEKMREESKNEGKFYKTFLGALTGVAAISLGAEWFERIARYGIFGGETRTQILQRIADSDTERVYKASIKAIQDGKSLDEIRAEAQNEMRKSNRFLQDEMDSVGNGVANDTAMAISTVNKSKLLYSAVMDGRTCEECRSLNGKIFESDSPDLPSVPRHNNCRCQLVPVADGGRTDGILMTFKEYFNTLTPAQQEARLGEEKYKLWKDGEYDLMDYEHPRSGERLTLEEWQSRDKGLFK